ncbi:MAG: ELM1/GtrOC1 family putative glycosyltransferase [Gammaproteobacteria bacterium]|nr:ELM1/GtrOC1 family putative glycosyltransferase [Gammaproteobacteria bacterium]
MQAPRRVALLLGGTSRSHELSRSEARRLTREVSAWAQSLQARLLVVGGRRSEPVMDTVAESLAPDDLLYRWQADDPANPYHEALRHAEQLVVTGESESMLADAVSRGRQFLIWPLPQRAASPWRRLSAAVADRAVRARYNARGSVKPQQGLTYLCARAIERGWILPPRDVEALHQRLFEQHMAAPFPHTADASFEPGEALQRTVQQAAQRLGLEPAGQPAADYGRNARLNQGTYLTSAQRRRRASMNGQLAE